MKKESYTSTVIIIIAMICTIGLFVASRVDSKEEFIEPEIIDSAKLARFERLEDMLKNSGYFRESKITFDKDNDIVKIDDKYEIYLKTGSYMMTIRNTKLESDYCKIVDAIEQGLGLAPGASIETCEETLRGSIGMGHISANIFDTYKVLLVNSEEPTSLYNIFQTHEEDELILVDEINYNISIDNYLFTSMSASYLNDAKSYSVCGHVYNDKKNITDEFVITTYDDAKNVLSEQSFKYENDTSIFSSFCTDYASETDNVKYYSISKR